MLNKVDRNKQVLVIVFEIDWSLKGERVADLRAGKDVNFGFIERAQQVYPLLYDFRSQPQVDQLAGSFSNQHACGCISVSVM